MSVATIQELDALVVRVKAAQQRFAEFTQEQVDLIFRQAALAAADARIPLARMAVEETGMGVLEDKVVKNHFASEYIYNAYKDEKTCGVLRQDDLYGTLTIAEPVGLICGIVPTTNPTSTAIFKALICLKTRNGIIFSPHPRARRSTCAAARLVLEAAVAAGAPPDIIGWIDEPTVELCDHLMRHPDINLILATGGPGMVQRRLLLGQAGHRRGRRQHAGGHRRDRRHQARGGLHPHVQDLRQRRGVRLGAVGDRGGQRSTTRCASASSSHGAHILDAEAVRGGAAGDPARRRAEPGDRRPVRAEDRRHGRDRGARPHPGADRRSHLGGRRGGLRPRKAVAHPGPVPGARTSTDAVAKAEALVALGGIGHTSVLYTDQDQPAGPGGAASARA